MRDKAHIEKSAAKRRKRAVRLRKIDAGEPVSDSSSVKERKQNDKEKYLAAIKRTSLTSQEEIDEARRAAAIFALQE